MGRGGGVPGERPTCVLGAGARHGESVRVGEQTADRVAESVHVPLRHDRACTEARDDLAEASDVVDDRRDARAQGLEQRTGLIQLVPVREHRDRGLAERVEDLVLAQESQTPGRPGACAALELVDRDARVTGHEQPRVGEPGQRRHGVVEALVGPDHAKREDRRAVVAARRIGREHGMSDGTDPRAVHTGLDEAGAPAVAVDDDPVEPVEERPPEAASLGCPARQEVVGREDERRAGAEEQPIGLGCRKPLEVEHVAWQAQEPRHADGMLEGADGDAQTAVLDGRGTSVEELAADVALGPRHGAEPEVRGRKRDLCAAVRQRRRQRVVVGRGESRGVGEDDAHPERVVAGLADASVRPPRARSPTCRMRAMPTDAPPVNPTFAEARAWSPVLERIAYLNAGTFGPIARATTDAVAAELRRDLEHGRSGMPRFTEVLERREAVRGALAALVGAEPGQVALTTSTTEGCNIVAAGLDLGPGDEIVTTTAEHPGLLLPLHQTGARVVPVEPSPDAVVAAVTPRTRLVALSQVLWTDGTVLPVAAIRAETGVPILVDGAQSVGAIPVSAAGIDYLTISGQKWLCGPDTTGGLVVADPDTLRVASPSYFSKISSEPDGSFEPAPGAARFHAVWWSAGSLSGLLAALEGRPSWWFERSTSAAERCRLLLDRRFEVVSPPHRATLVAFRPEGDPAEVVALLLERGVHVRDIPGTGLVRVSCGWWTSDEDLDRLVEALG